MQGSGGTVEVQGLVTCCLSLSSLSLSLSRSLRVEGEPWSGNNRLRALGLVTCCLSLASLSGLEVNRCSAHEVALELFGLVVSVPVWVRRLPYHIAFFSRLDLYHKSPDSGTRQYKSRTCKR